MKILLVQKGKTNRDSLYNLDTLSAINETDREYQSGSSIAIVPPNPPAPPAPPAPHAPPAPLPNLTTPVKPVEDSQDDRSALLSDIRVGLKLKKAVTNDRSKPII